VTSLTRALELCVFCPKMCRFACPASEVTSREAFTPWGKVSLAALAGRAPDESAALAFAACTGCLRCQTYCAHANDVPALLYAARAGAAQGASGVIAATIHLTRSPRDDRGAPTIYPVPEPSRRWFGPA